MDDERTSIVDRREPSRDPSANRMLVRAQNGGSFGYRVCAMDFDAAAIEPPGHALGRLFDEVADILDPPRCYPRTELHRPRECAGLHLPPESRRGKREDRGYQLRLANVARFRQRTGRVGIV